MFPGCPETPLSTRGGSGDACPLIIRVSARTVTMLDRAQSNQDPVETNQSVSDLSEWSHYHQQPISLIICFELRGASQSVIINQPQIKGWQRDTNEAHSSLLRPRLGTTIAATSAEFHIIVGVVINFRRSHSRNSPLKSWVCPCSCLSLKEQGSFPLSPSGDLGTRLAIWRSEESLHFCVSLIMTFLLRMHYLTFKIALAKRFIKGLY